MTEIVRLAIVFLLAGTLLYALERFRPSIRQRLWRQGTGTDLIYWFFTPLVTKAVSRAAVLVTVVVAGLTLGLSRGPELAAGFGPVARQPVWLVALEMLVVGDFIGYWTHRLFHRGRLWRFHAIHHSSTQLDWLSSVRLHPVNDILSRVVQVTVLLFLGFPLTALAAYIPFLSFYALLLHANLSWSFGPLRFAIASPRFHRWHHTSEAEGCDKNFAGLFPIWDLLFGTFYMPRERQPRVFGVEGYPVPSGFWGQMIAPFRKTPV